MLKVTYVNGLGNEIRRDLHKTKYFSTQEDYIKWFRREYRTLGFIIPLEIITIREEA